MKRNYLPDDPDRWSDEQEIIDERLRELFSDSSDQYRQAPAVNKGCWLEDKQYVKIESNKGISSELVKFSPKLNHYFLEKFEALYCLESNQIIIYFRGIPLSLPEAYQLLLTDRIQFRNYRVFQQLNRQGCICLKPASSNLGSDDATTTKDDSSFEHDSNLPQSLVQQDDKDKPLSEIDSIYPGLKDVLKALRKVGPQDYKDLVRSKQTDSPRDGLNISFDVYKRGNFVSKKPRRSKQGEPDFQLVICDKPTQKPPNCKQLLESSIQGAIKPSEKLLFALVDDDYSICFSQFKPVISLDPALV